ncbi:50S ribosomal protein L6 [bacterium]|nr:50S ribosomal protein L6 [bacterium]MCG2675629.1 50S ribosomal protein L6 [bacterium]
MSRVGEKPIIIPEGVKVQIEGNILTAEGPKGKLVRKIPSEIKVEVKGKEILTKRPSNAKSHKSLHGLSRTLLANMIKGVSEGFSKTLEIIGVGYKANPRGDKLILSLGFSNPVEFSIPKGIEIKAEKGTQITISGPDKGLVGETASTIRALKPPEPYKGKGIKYKGEYIKRKVGKTAVTGSMGT